MSAGSPPRRRKVPHWGKLILGGLAIYGIVAYIGIPAFIVTLAGMLLFRGVALMTLQNTNIGPFDDRFRAIGNGFLDKENALGSAIGMTDMNGAALVATGIAILALIWIFGGLH